MKLGPGGTLDPSFGDGGRVVLRLPDESGADQVRVTGSGEVLIAATKVPRARRHEGEEKWWSRSSPMLIGLTADGHRDLDIGPHGIAVKHIAGWWEDGGSWIDSHDRPTLTVGFRPKPEAPLGLAAVRFAAP